jgi:hypothetical protein
MLHLLWRPFGYLILYVIWHVLYLEAVSPHVNQVNKNKMNEWIGIHTAELLVPDLCLFEAEIAIAKLKRYKSPGSDQIPAALIHAGGETLQSDIHKLINSRRNKEELPNQWKESIIVAIHKKGNKTHCSNYCEISLLSILYKILSKILLSGLIIYIHKIIGIISVGFEVRDHLLIRSFTFVRYYRKKWEYNETVHQLFVDFKNSYDSVRKKVMYNIESGAPHNLGWLIYF